MPDRRYRIFKGSRGGRYYMTIKKGKVRRHYLKKGEKPPKVSK